MGKNQACDPKLGFCDVASHGEHNGCHFAVIPDKFAT